MRNTTLAAAITADSACQLQRQWPITAPRSEGKIFADMTNINTRKPAKIIRATGTGIDVKRFYSLWTTTSRISGPQT